MVGKSISILLVVVILLQSFGQLDVLTYFELNRTYIAENYCINRDKPWLHCDGKCYLKKELKKTAGKKNSAINNKTDVVLYCENNIVHLPFIEPQREKQLAYLKERSYIAPDFSIFHPPCVSNYYW